MKREITLQELAAYLPWGVMMHRSIERVRLSGLHDDWSKGGVQVIYLSQHHESFHKHGGKSASGFTETYPLNYVGHCQFKPLLRPLSDLTREITHEGTKVVLLDWINENTPLRVIMAVDSSGKSCLWCENVQSSHFNAWPYSLHKILASFHFDIFGLIPDGLAIDINTIDQ